MNAIEALYYYANMIMVVTMLTLTLMILVLCYFIRVKKVIAKKENIDTSKFRREDAISYASFEDIVSRDGSIDSDGMIVINDNTFVAGLSVRGFEYPTASADEKIDVQVNSIQFFNVVEKPTTFRRTVRTAELSSNIEEYKEIAKRLSYELLDLEAEYKETMDASESFLEDPEQYAPYANRLRELQKMHFAKKHMLEESSTLIEYMGTMSGDGGNKEDAISHTASQIMFSFVFNPNEYAEDLTKEEIYEIAMEELDGCAQSYADALAACHFRAKRLSAKEIIGLMRKHTSPITGEDFDLSELLDSSYTSLFVTSDSLVEACKDKIKEDEYFRLIESVRERNEEKLKLQAQERTVKAAALKERAFEQAYEELDREGV